MTRTELKVAALRERRMELKLKVRRAEEMAAWAVEKGYDGTTAVEQRDELVEQMRAVERDLLTGMRALDRERGER